MINFENNLYSSKFKFNSLSDSITLKLSFVNFLFVNGLIISIKINILFSSKISILLIFIKLSLYILKKFSSNSEILIFSIP